MVPYRGRNALRIVRLAMAVLLGLSYLAAAGLGLNWIVALQAAYLAYATGAMFEQRFDTQLRSAIAIVADASYFALWAWMWSWPRPVGAGAAEWAIGWEAAIACGYLLVSTMLLHDLTRVAVTGAVALAIALLLPQQATFQLAATVIALTGVSIACGLYKSYLAERMSLTLRHNVIIRSQAQGAREAERQRVAADFHDGPMQSFISFQMRLELIRKLMSRDPATAAEELRQLQELCKAQVADLRGFVRSMRPADDGMSLSASFSRMTELFQRDTGISSSYEAGDIPDPGATEISLELLQIVREAFNNVQKHSGATRVRLIAARRDHEIEVALADNGGGFPFAGTFTLEELELLRLGPSSIKRRVQLLDGSLSVESHPGEGARISIRVPV